MRQNDTDRERRNEMNAVKKEGSSKKRSTPHPERSASSRMQFTIERTTSPDGAPDNENVVPDEGTKVC